MQRLAKEYIETGMITRKEEGRSGRPRKTDEREDREILRAVQGLSDKRRKNSQEIVDENDLSVISRTIRRRLEEEVLLAKIALQKPLLAARNIEKRLQ